MRVVFFGTPDAAVPSLEALDAAHTVSAVVTQPDRPRGRSRTPLPSPLKVAATRLGLPVHQPERSKEVADILRSLDPVHVAVVVAFGMLVRPEALSIPHAGFVNVHFSLLPRWRGAAPVQRALIAGDDRTGVTLMKLDEGLDTGPMLVTSSTAIGPDETGGSVTDRLARLGADLLVRHLDPIVAGAIVPLPQPAGATNAAKLSAEDRRFRPEVDGATLRRSIMAMSPLPGLTAELDGSGFKLIRAGALESGRGELPAGTLAEHRGRLWVVTGDSLVELVEVQPAGRRVMSGTEWLRGRGRPLGRLG